MCGARSLSRRLSKSTRSSVAPSGCCGPFGAGGTIDGFVKEGFEHVREAFEANFANRLELGAQLTIYIKGELVVDLVGAAPEVAGYGPDTLQCVFSSGKNLEAIAIAMLVDRGLISYSDKVIKHWPEYGQHGKEEVTIADVMRHEGGVPYLADPADPDDMSHDFIVSTDDLRNVKQLEAKFENAARSPPGDNLRCYHAITRGWVVNGILRRVDPAGRSLGTFIREEISDPLGVTFFCGIPEAEQGRFTYADMTPMPKAYNIAFNILPAIVGCGCPQLRASIKMVTDKTNPLTRPVAEWLGKSPKPDFNNSTEGRALEIPSGGMYTNARSMAVVNAVMAGDGSFRGVRLLSAAGVARAMGEIKVAEDVGFKTSFGFSQGGFGRFSDAFANGASPPMLHPADRVAYGDFMGWGGAGGSISIWDCEKEVSFAYTMNAMSNSLLGGPGVRAILTELQALI